MTGIRIDTAVLAELSVRLSERADAIALTSTRRPDIRSTSTLRNN